MTRYAITFAVVLAGLLPAAPALACYADYKAKRSSPLQLHYGVIDLPESACGSREAAAPVIARRIAGDGWTLLTVMSIFGEDGLAGRRQSAGEFYLRY